MGGGELHQISAAIGQLQGQLAGMQGWMRRIEAEGNTTAANLQEIKLLLSGLKPTLESISTRLSEVEQTTAMLKRERAVARLRTPIAAGAGGVGGGGVVLLLMQIWDVVRPYLAKIGG